MINVLGHETGVLHLDADALRHLADLLARANQFVTRQQVLGVMETSGVYSECHTIKERR